MWRTKIRLTDETAEAVDIRIGDDVAIRVSRVPGGMAVVVAAPRAKPIIRSKADGEDPLFAPC